LYQDVILWVINATFRNESTVLESDETFLLPGFLLVFKIIICFEAFKHYYTASIFRATAIDAPTCIASLLKRAGGGKCHMHE